MSCSGHRIKKPPLFQGWLFDSILDRRGLSVKLRGRSVGPETLGRFLAGVLLSDGPTRREIPFGVSRRDAFGMSGIPGT
jgi:hypothetical protein